MINQLAIISTEYFIVIYITRYIQTPLILRKSDGGYGYDSTDMACIRHR